MWQTVGEGHNDIAMALMALLWLFLLLREPMERSAWRSPPRRSANIPMAPLMLIDALHCLKTRAHARMAICVRLVLPALFTMAVLAAFYRSPQFFDGVKLLSTWHFLQPVDAFAAVNKAAGGWLGRFGFWSWPSFRRSPIHQCVVFWKRPDTENCCAAPRR